MAEEKEKVCKTRRGQWGFRRRLVVYTLGFCASCVAWVLLKEMDNETVRTVTSSAFGLSGAVIGSYIFGAVWNDKNKGD